MVVNLTTLKRGYLNSHNGINVDLSQLKKKKQTQKRKEYFTTHSVRYSISLILISKTSQEFCRPESLRTASKRIKHLRINFEK